MSLSSALSDISDMSVDDLEKLAEQVQARIAESKRENVDERIAAFKKSDEYKSLVKRMKAVVKKGDKLDNIEADLHVDLTLHLSVSTREHMCNVVDGCERSVDDLFEVKLSGEVKGRMPQAVKETLQQAVDRYTEDACDDLWTLFPAFQGKIEEVEIEVFALNDDIGSALNQHNLEFDDAFDGLFDE